MHKNWSKMTVKTYVTKDFLLKINEVLFNFLFIKGYWKKHIHTSQSKKGFNKKQPWGHKGHKGKEKYSFLKSVSGF